MNLTYEGRCWKLGDNVSSDELISAQHVFEYDPNKLRVHLLEEHLPAFAKQAKAGDLVLAGKRFAHGSQHTHPFLAMKAIGIGLLAQSPLRPTYRLAVYCGIPLFDIEQPVLEAIDDGDNIRVDFSTGEIHNRTRDERIQVTPLPNFLLDIIRAGGGMGFLQSAATATQGK